MRIIIVGGGFSGVKCAKTLRKHLSEKECEIVMFDHENHMVFHPLLAEVAGASIHPDAAAVPLRQMLPTVFCRTERVIEVDFEKKQVVYEAYDFTRAFLAYDQVVIAAGCIVNMGLVPGMADHGFPLKTIVDAMTLRSQIIQQLEKAEVESDAARRKLALSFLVVGGGFSGVEVAGELNDFARKCTRFFHGVSTKDIQVTLVHSRDQILPEIRSPKLRDFARVEMEKEGIRFVLNSRVVAITANGVRLADQSMLYGSTVVTTTGTAMPDLVEGMKTAKEKGALVAEPDMRLKGVQDAWTIGDNARITNAYDNNICPTTAQFAERQGTQAAENIIRILKNKPTKPFYYRPQGLLCSIGGKRAVAEVSGLRLSGFIAWFLWRGIYLLKMPTWSRRIKIGFDWAWDLLFAVDLVYFSPKATERLSNAYYQAGDFIFRQGDPALNFYVVEEGEVEVLRRTEGSTEEKVVAVFGVGDFFGEMALLDKRPHSASIRARTPVRVLAMGSQLFHHISGALTPLKTMIVEAARKRVSSIWQSVPEAQPILEHKPLRDFIEPLPYAPFRGVETFGDILKLFNDQHMEIGFVVDAAGLLKGLITRTDLFRALAEGARLHTPLEQFMMANPRALAQDEPIELAIAIMRERHLKWLPVVESQAKPVLVGYIRTQKILEVILEHIPTETVKKP
jgi:NADH dehydrogenase